MTRSVLVGAFAPWRLPAPGLPGNAVLNDVMIVLCVVDLAILSSSRACRAVAKLAAVGAVHRAKGGAGAWIRRGRARSRAPKHK